MDEKKGSTDRKSVVLAIHYNWPSGKNSISSIGASPSTKIRILKSDAGNPEQLFEWDPLDGGPKLATEISKILSEEASKGSYFTGDIFFIHAKDEEAGKEMRARFDAYLEKPANATGGTSVFTKYIFEI